MGVRIARAIAEAFEKESGVMIRKIVPALLPFCFFITDALADCPKEKETIEQFTQSDQILGWPALHTSYKNFIENNSCDDGAIAEGYSDLIAIMLSSHWKEMPALQKLMTFDPAFGVFVLRHIDATASGDQLVNIMRQANTRCPNGMQTFCRQIVDHAQKAHADSREY